MENTSRFRVVALPLESFNPFFSLNETALVEHQAQRVIVDAHIKAPCRVSLQDAKAGERVLLLSFVHQATNSPYRSSGPIFVRETAKDTVFAIGEVPAILRNRLLSLRAYDAPGIMTEAEVVEGKQLEAQVEKLFTNERVAYLHVHNARYGCYFCRIDRA